MGCVFCELPDQEPGKLLDENGYGYVIAPLGREDGSHLLVVPRLHVESFRGMVHGSPALMQLLEGACEVVRKAADVDSVSVSLNYGRDAGQTVFHFHWWVIARPPGELASGLGMAALLRKVNDS